MPDAEDQAIVRQLTRAVAAAIFCLLCGGIAGLFVVRDDTGSVARHQRVELAPTSPPSG